MGLSHRHLVPLACVKVDRNLVSSRTSILPAFAVILLFVAFAYLLWLPVLYVFGLFHSLVSYHAQPTTVPRLGQDAIKHFAGSRDCKMLQSDIYVVPHPLHPKVSPFCKDRETLLEALSSGGRLGLDEPYVGKSIPAEPFGPQDSPLMPIGCTYRWFSTPEICMIIERFNAIAFIGDHTAQAIYKAFNVLLREDLAFGGVQQWNMNKQEHTRCKCDSQFFDTDCLGYAIRSSEDVKTSGAGEGNGTPYFCDRITHAYIPVGSVPASAAARALFKDLTYGRPNPWQPTPLIISFGDASSSAIEITTQSLDEWLALASGAERNIPVLFLGPPAVGHGVPHGTTPPDGDTHIHEQLAAIAKQRHVDVLSIYNFTQQATTVDGEYFGERVALVEAMMVMNWFSKLETS